MVIGMNEEIWRELLREQQLQMLYSVRSERLLMQEIDYSMLFRWFVGLNLDEGVRDASSFTRIVMTAGGRRGEGISGEGGRTGADRRADVG